MSWKMTTVNGYQMLDVASAMQKAIRRNDTRRAGYWACELYESGYTEYVWKRLFVISAEDCYGVITKEIESLYRACQMVTAGKKHNIEKRQGRIFLCKAAILLSEGKKSRDADHLKALVRDPNDVDFDQLQAEIEEARKHPMDVEIPGYAFDCHTHMGRRAGKTKQEFFIEEFEALKPRQMGLFDEQVEKLKRGDIRVG